jgi:hypothetical protein
MMLHMRNLVLEPAGIVFCGFLFGCSSSGDQLTCRDGDFYLNGQPFTDCSQCSDPNSCDFHFEYGYDGFVQIVISQTATCKGQTVSINENGVCENVVPSPGIEAGTGGSAGTTGIAGATGNGGSSGTGGTASSGEATAGMGGSTCSLDRTLLVAKLTEDQLRILCDCGVAPVGGYGRTRTCSPGQFPTRRPVLQV